MISRIVAFASKNPGCDIAKISQGTGISQRKIVDLIHEGLLRRFGLKIIYPCRICGADINTGTLCFWCSDKLYRLIDQLKDSIWGDPDSRKVIEAAGLQPDLREEDWDKVATLFSESIFRRRSERNISYRSKKNRGGFYRC
ncbi:MAG: hypothetical protein Kow0029_10150 [Candidatus Rifleibacteriota bacterium]